MKAMLWVAIICLCALAAQADIVLVKDGQDPCPIFFRAEATKSEKDAATQLAAYLSKISGAAFSAQAAVNPLPERAILVG